MSTSTMTDLQSETLSNKLPPDRSIGAILVDSGRLAPEAAEAILREQKEKKTRFGDAAIALGLLTAADIEFALSRQFRYPYLQPGDMSVSEELVAAFQPFSPLVEQLRALRTQLMLRWFGDDPAQRALAIVGSRHGEGRTFIAANLAVVFSQLGERTLLIDGNLRSPRIHELFKLGNRSGLSSILAGRGTENTFHRVPQMMDLTVLPAGPAAPNPQELLSRDTFSNLLKAVGAKFDVIIIDTPGTLDAADAFIVSNKTGAAVVVARKDFSLAKPAQDLAANMIHSGVQLIGSIFNEA